MHLKMVESIGLGHFITNGKHKCSEIDRQINKVLVKPPPPFKLDLVWLQAVQVHAVWLLQSRVDDPLHT